MRDTGGQVADKSFLRRSDHSDIEAMQSLLLDELTRRAELEETPCEILKLKQAIQSDAYAKADPYEPIIAPYESLGMFAGFKGKPDAVKGRVRHMINTGLSYNAACGSIVFGITKGGEILRDARRHIRYNDFGEIMRTSTTIVDYLKAEADAALTRAKQKAAANKKQWYRVRVEYMTAERDEAINRLPKWSKEVKEEKEADDPRELPTDEYIRRGIKQILTRAENFAVEIDKRGFDVENVLEEIETQISRLKKSLQKTAPARNDNFALERVKSGQNSSFSEQNEVSRVMSTLPTPPIENKGNSETICADVTPQGVTRNGVTNNTHIPPCVPKGIEGYAKADLTPLQRAKLHVETFQKLGTTELWFGFKDDVAGQIVDENRIAIEDFLKDLSSLLDQSERHKLSLIIRPYAENTTFIQLDEHLEETLSCAVLETSRNNYQSWMAVSDCENYEVLRRALIRQTSADKGASGACRIAGSRNFKPQRNDFQIKLIKAEEKRASVRDLETAFNFSLQDEIQKENQHRAITPTSNIWNGVSFPNWSMARGKSDSEREASFLATCRNWGIPSDVAYQKLTEVAPREKQKRADYKRRTLKTVYGEV